MPNYFWNEPQDNHDGIHVFGHFEHPGDTVRIQHVAIPIGLLVEEWARFVGFAGHGQLDMAEGVVILDGG